MTTAQPRALLFDFFGTLATYEPDRTRLGYPKSHALAVSWGLSVSHHDFVSGWDAASTVLEEQSRRSLREFAMIDVARVFASEAGLDLSPDHCAKLGCEFASEWEQHVRPILGVPEMLDRLALDWTIGVVSNTNEPNMVPRLLAGVGLSGAVSVVVLSVDHGWCKPHESIYRYALDLVRVSADRAVFVGDNHEADFVGPEAVGIRSYLIDPNRLHPVAPERQLDTVLDVEARLTGECT